MDIVLDNIIYSKTNNGGVSNYWYEITKFLLARENDRVTFYEEAFQDRNFHRNLLNLPAESIISGQSSKSLFKARVSSLRHDFPEHFLYHSSYYRALKGPKNFSEITTVHDFTHNFFLPYHKKVLHNRLKYASIKRADGIICISKSTYNDLMRFCPPQKKQKVEVIYNGVSNDYFPEKSKQGEEFLTKSGINGDYLLYVGSRAGYKNFSFVTELLKQVPQFRLVVVGNNFSEKELKAIDPSVRSGIVLLTDIGNPELNILYNYAHAFIYPSSYEGFGIPVIEAMKAGCPVLALNNSSISEVSGNAGLLFDKMDLRDFENALERLQNETFRQETAEKGILQAGQYSWEKCCGETYAFYKENY